ncbi:MAG: TonB family protein [Crocinitomix sp.]|nr:TonB family protein [Crocinitomix sp.]
MKNIIALTLFALINLTAFAGNENHGIDPAKKLFEKWTKEFVAYPSQPTIEMEEGVVLVSFEIDEYGKMKNILVESEVSAALNEKAIEMVQTMPIEHLYSNGFIEGTRFVLPVKFNLQ